MKVLVIGATGGTGSQILQSALGAGHDVTALARSPSKIQRKDKNLRVIAGDVLDSALVVKAMQGQEGVLSGLGPSKGSRPGTLISRGTQNILEAMKNSGTQRLVFESGLMVGDGSGMNAAKRLILASFRTLNKTLYNDKVLAEKLIMESQADWIIVRPPMLKHIPARNKYVVGENLNVDLLAGVSHADVADFMVKALLDGTYLRTVVDISY